ncbi:MAG: mechanosensitive ion channel [Nitrospirae bacterium]|nr:mechanosensitive ion channel [Nitrospirota bacterium]
MDSNLKGILIPSATTILSIAVLLVLRNIAFGILNKWARMTETDIDDIIIRSFKTPSIYWIIAIGLYIGVAISGLPEKYIFYLSKTIHVIVILSVTVATANLSGKIFTTYIQKSKLPIPTTGLANVILKGVILILGLLIALSVIGISITPFLTALGVGGLAVALALQDTLSNLFAGVHILVEKSVSVGDFIKLETGQEGCVDDITWRTTRIRMPNNNMVIIPNSKLSQSIVTNYNLPEKSMSLAIPIGVSYSSEPEKVEQILIEEATKAVGHIPGLLGNPGPAVRFIPGFGESSLNFTLVCQVKEFTDQFPVQHELRKIILKRFREEGIEIPFPHRTVYLREEDEWKKQESSGSGNS